MEINGHPKYLIYDDGRVQNKKTKRFLKPAESIKGYLNVHLHHNRNGTTARIHRLVALHYIPNPENKREVDHIDRNKSNNNISNLRWATRSENCQNTIKQINNKSGHKNIHPHSWGGWEYKKVIRGKEFRRFFNTKTDALCFKYIRLLQKNLV